MALKHRRSLGKASVPFDQLDGKIWFNCEFVAWERRQDPRINVAIAIEHWSSYFQPHRIAEGHSPRYRRIRHPDPKTAPCASKAAGLYMICTISKHAAEAKGYADAMMLDEQLHEEIYPAVIAAQ
ncbi:hypothetical protein HFO97_15925 [Rhizobium leguminosarum]|nr:hypothetical protein [Rhizobium leguminosarum]